MSALPSKTAFVTLEEYFRLSDASEEKLQYSRGRVFPVGCDPSTYNPAVDMAGGSLEHGQIAANIVRFVGNRLAGNPCRVYGSDVRIGAADRSNHFPDASIICGPAETNPGDRNRHTFTNPSVIFEVLSPSTARYDFDEKFGHYRTIAALQEYVLVHQDRPDVSIYFLQDDGNWAFRSFTGLTGEVPLRAVGIALPLSEIYDGVSFTDDTA